jgi:hypothetical protein
MGPTDDFHRHPASPRVHRLGCHATGPTRLNGPGRDPGSVALFLAAIELA